MTTGSLLSRAVGAALIFGVLDVGVIRLIAQSTTDTAMAVSAFAALPGRQIWYRDTGEPGVPIVFLHAGRGSSLVWQHQIPAVKAAGYRFIAYDRLGYGQSVMEKGASPGTAVDDLQALMDYLKIERFHLVGTAAGGIVALDFALSFPERLRSLVVANSVFGIQDDDFLALGRRIRPAPQFESLPSEFKELGPSYRAENVTGTARWIELEHASRAKDPLASPQRPRNRLTFTLLDSLRVPTLLLTGDADLYSPPAVLRIVAGKIRGAEAIVVPEAGHSAYWEQPESFNRVVLGFIGRH